MSKPTTGFDVARLAGVSQPTVSRALRNLPGTSAKTRRRVIEAAKALSYIPSDSARALSSRRTQRIAVVSEALTNPYYPELVEPIRRQLAEQGYRTVLLTDRAEGAVELDELADGSYDGIILTTTTRTSRLPRELTERSLPHVLVNRLLDHAESSSCGVDNRGGTAAVADLLVSLGHTVIASVQGPNATSTGHERSDGLARGLRRHGVELRRHLRVRAEFSHDAGRAVAFDLLTGFERPTAVVCGNDVMAMGVLSAAVECGLRVPRDLTVIGFDDIAMAGWPMIGLTTVRVDRGGMATEAVRMLVEQIEGASRVMEYRAPATLVLRATHGPVAAVGHR